MNGHKRKVVIKTNRPKSCLNMFKNPERMKNNRKLAKRTQNNRFLNARLQQEIMERTNQISFMESRNMGKPLAVPRHANQAKKHLKTGHTSVQFHTQTLPGGQNAQRSEKPTFSKAKTKAKAAQAYAFADPV